MHKSMFTLSAKKPLPVHLHAKYLFVWWNGDTIAEQSLWRNKLNKSQKKIYMQSHEHIDKSNGSNVTWKTISVQRQIIIMEN